MPEEKTPAEIAAEKINESITGIREMVEKSATVEALDAAKKDFEDFKASNDLSEYQDKIVNLEKDLKAVTVKVGNIRISDNQQGTDLMSRIKSALDTETWKEHLERRAEGESPVYELKDINWGAAGSGGTNDVVPNARPFLIPQYPFEEPFDVRSFVPLGTVDTGSLTYPQEVLHTDGMGTNAETGASTITTITFEDVTENAHRIATHAIVSRRALRNTTWLSAYLATRFMEKYVKLLNTQVLVGNGVGEDLTGIMTKATDYALGGPLSGTIPATESSLWDALLAMKTQLNDTANVMANACFVSPNTHFQLTVQKATTRQYAYDGVMIKVDESGVWRVNGMTLVISKDIPDGDAFIGVMLPTAVQLLMNGGIDMSTSNSHADIFTSSQVAFRFEADVILAVYRPYAFLKGTLQAVQDDITAV